MGGNGYKIFVGGLNYNTTDESLRDYFEQFGPLQDYIVMKTGHDQKSRGFGFVVYENENSMEKVLETPKGHVVDGRTVEVKNATPREEVRGGGGGRPRFEGRDNGRGSRFVTADGDRESKIMRKLFVGGLSYNTTEAGMAAYFMNFGPLAEHVLMTFPDSGKSKGFGFVVFEKAQDLDVCQEARPHKLDNKQIDTKRATPASAAGRPEAMVSVKRIFIAGLKDEDVSDTDIEEYFSQFGLVTNVEQMLWNDTGKKRGFGFVEFKDSDIVDKVCLLGGHEVKGISLDVKKALSKDEMKEAEYRQEQKREGRDDMGRSGPNKRQRMDEQWNSGMGNGGGNGWGNMGGGGNDGMNPMKMMQNETLNNFGFGGNNMAMKMMQMMMGMFGGNMNQSAPGNSGHDQALMYNMMNHMAKQGRQNMSQMGSSDMSSQQGGQQNDSSSGNSSGGQGAAAAGSAAGYWGGNGQQQGGSGYGGYGGSWGASGGQSGGYGGWGGQDGSQQGGASGYGGKRESGGDAQTYYGTSGYSGRPSRGGRDKSSY